MTLAAPAFERPRPRADDRGMQGHATAVLIVDDVVEIRLLVRLLLAELGIEDVDEVDNGAAAVAAVRERAYALVVMDLNMPVMDGLAATAAVMRERPGTVVVAYTSWADVETPGQFLAAGARAHFWKWHHDEMLVYVRTQLGL